MLKNGEKTPQPYKAPIIHEENIFLSKHSMARIVNLDLLGVHTEYKYDFLKKQFHLEGTWGFI